MSNQQKSNSTNNSTSINHSWISDRDKDGKCSNDIVIDYMLADQHFDEYYGLVQTSGKPKTKKQHSEEIIDLLLKKGHAKRTVEGVKQQISVIKNKFAAASEELRSLEVDPFSTDHAVNVKEKANSVCPRYYELIPKYKTFPSINKAAVTESGDNIGSSLNGLLCKKSKPPQFARLQPAIRQDNNGSSTEKNNTTNNIINSDNNNNPAQTLSTRLPNNHVDATTNLISTSNVVSPIPLDIILAGQSNNSVQHNSNDVAQKRRAEDEVTIASALKSNLSNMMSNLLEAHLEQMKSQESPKRMKSDEIEEDRKRKDQLFIKKMEMKLEMFKLMKDIKEDSELFQLLKKHIEKIDEW